VPELPRSSAAHAAVLCVRLHPHLAAAHYEDLARLLFEIPGAVVELQPPVRALAAAPTTPPGWEGPVPPAGLLQRVAFERYGLATRVGVGPNRLTAELAACNARLGTLCRIRDVDAAAFARGWDVAHLPGVTPEHATAMRRAGLCRIGDVAAVEAAALVPFLGREEAGVAQLAALGRDPRPLLPSPRLSTAAASDRTARGRTTPTEMLWRRFTDTGEDGDSHA
jgi:hypothetical protein